MTVESTGGRRPRPSPHTAAAPAPEVVLAARGGARLSKWLETALGEVGLSLPQYRLLAFLSGGPERATALAEWLSVSPPSLTALVDGAVSKGLVERVAVQGDRRCVRHVMTGAGEAALAEADASVSAELADLVGLLPPAQARKALEGLALVGVALDAARERKQPATTGGAGKGGATGDTTGVTR